MRDFFVDVSGSVNTDEAAEYVAARLRRKDNVYVCSTSSSQVRMDDPTADLATQLRRFRGGGLDLGSIRIVRGRRSVLVTDIYTRLTENEETMARFGTIAELPLCPVCRRPVGDRLLSHVRAAGDPLHLAYEVVAS